ncbi:MAG TPA: 4Fe-4S binding protein [Smithella sp.]|nr:4Fe-4S binding protein [Smithella sp.]
MEDGLYRKLQKQLDSYSLGFPATESGIEIEILKDLFTKEDAELFTNMTPVLETPESVSARLGRNPTDVARRLEDMAARGLLFRLKKDNEVKYGAIPFMHGLLEFKIKNLSKNRVVMFEKYFREGFQKAIAGSGGLFLRTIPVKESIEAQRHIAAFDDACAILLKADLIVITDCICRKSKSVIDNACGKPVEVCFMFGSMAKYYLDNKMGRKISYDEGVAILTEAQKAGLVTQPASSQNPGGICNCCGDCCGILRAIKLDPKPADLVYSNHQASVICENCSGCEICLDRCQMDAITINHEGIAVIDYDRCIGCGLCVMTCPSDAMFLEEKPEGEKKVPPKNSSDQMLALAKKRGII